MLGASRIMEEVAVKGRRRRPTYVVWVDTAANPTEESRERPSS